MINAVALLPSSKQSVGGIHGMQPTYLYQFVVGLIFPSAGTASAPSTIAPFPVLGAEFVPGRAPFEVLLGRDVLCNGVFTMTFDGRMTFSV